MKFPRFETARAKAGATLLDLIRPGWANEIDVGQLKLESGRSCVLGQLFGWYSDGVEKLFAIRIGTPDKSGFLDRLDAAAADGGFCIPQDIFARASVKAVGRLYDNLTRAWKREIARRVSA